jgi:MOSC domain-containing protein YiiM
LLDDLRAHGFEVSPGSLGENILTEGLDILSLPRDTQLRLGADAVVRLTGLRNPCAQLDGLQPGLLGVHFERDAAGALVRRPGVMAVVVRGGVVAPGDSIEVALPAGERVALERV